MTPFIAGNNLSDLSRNSLIAQGQDDVSRQATANLLLNQLLAANQQRTANNHFALQRDMASQDFGLRNNALLQQGRQFDANLGLQREMGMLPYQQRALSDIDRNALLKRQLDIQEAAAKNNPLSAIDPSLRNAMIQQTNQDIKLQRDADGVAGQMNQLLAGRINELAYPKLVDRLDYGSDNPGPLGIGISPFFSGGLYHGNAEKAAKGILGMDVMPEDYATDRAVSGTSAWWNSPTNTYRNGLADVAAKLLLQEHPEASASVQFSGGKFVPKQQTIQSPFSLLRFGQPQSTVAPPAITGTNRPDVNSIIADAQNAIRLGADPAAVRLRLQQSGINLQ